MFGSTHAHNGTVLALTQDMDDAGWLAGAVALLGLSVLAPIGETSALPAFAGPPPSLTQTQEMIGALKALEVASPDALEKLAERAAELVRRPPGSQFEVTAEN